MKKLLFALFAALVLSQAADAQLFRRPARQGIGQWVLVDGRWVYIDVQPQALAPKAPTAPAQPVTVQADAARPGGKVRGFLKRLLGR